ncbi:MAG: arginase family protein, partial [Pseudomonadota bacterium]
ENFGQTVAHGTPFYYAIEEGLIDPERYIMLGIRAPHETALMDETRERGVTVLTAEDVHMLGVDVVAGHIRRVLGDRPSYLTFDVDGLDPAFAPGTGTPEIGGLHSWQTRAIMARLTAIPFVGMDVVEVAPPFDTAEITALAAATVVFDYLALMQTQGLLPPGAGGAS